MPFERFVRTVSGTALGALLCVVAFTATAMERQAASASPLGFNTARVTIEGNSNLHPWTASSTAVRLTRVQVGANVTGPDFWTAIVRPGALQAFDVAVPVATLSSPKEGLDKNMHKALKALEHPEITFSLVRLEPGAEGALHAIGVLHVAGTEREVTLDLTTRAKDDALTLDGEVQLLMTDFGISPPKAMLGMLKTDPKVTVRIEAVLAISLT